MSGMPREKCGCILPRLAAAANGLAMTIKWTMDFARRRPIEIFPNLRAANQWLDRLGAEPRADASGDGAG